MTHGSLFSGIGGFDLAAEWMGWQNVFHCEWNTFGQKVLHHYWPNAISYHDITKTDFTIHRGTIDILTGGFPCQPYSMAGKRKGKDDERHLWPQMCRAIKEIQPRWVVGENVFGIVNWSDGLVFQEVQAELEAQGYQVQPFVLPAAAVNAPHRRDRVWFVAYSIGASERANEFRSLRREDGEIEKERAQTFYNATGSNGVKGAAPDTDRFRFDRGECEHEKQPGEGREYAQRDIEQMGESDVADTSSIGLQRLGQSRKLERKRFSFYDSQGNRPTWQNFPSQSPVCSGNDGIPTGLDGITFSKWRNESIKAYGNAVVPQVVYQIFKAIAEYDRANYPDANNGAPPAGGVVRE